MKFFCGQIYAAGKTLVKALYMAGGPSARLTDISAWMVCNTDANQERNVRFIRKLIAVVNTYTELQEAGISEQKVVCFVDVELIGLVLTYLIVLKRFECLVIKDVPEFDSIEADKRSRVWFLIAVYGDTSDRYHRQYFAFFEYAATSGRAGQDGTFQVSCLFHCQSVKV
jgi:hypothetical protein